MMFRRFLVAAFALCPFATVRSQSINWEKHFASAQTGTALQLLSDGGYLAAGGYTIGSVVRTNSNGDSLWSKNYDDGSQGLSILAVADVGDGYVLGGSYQSHPYIMKVDQTGAKQWDRYVGGSSAYGEVNAVLAVSGGVVTTGYAFAGGGYSLTTAKFSASGDSIWKQSINAHKTTNGRSVLNTSGNSIISSGTGFVIAGTADTEVYLLKVDANGVALWDKSYSGVHSSSDNDEGKCVRATADGGFIICGGRALSNASSNTVVDLLKTTADGTLSWRKDCSSPGGYGFQVIAESDGYVLGASINGAGHVLKTDLSGVVTSDGQLAANTVAGLVKSTTGSYVAAGTWPVGGMYLGSVSFVAARYFVILDAKGRPIANKDVTFYKGTMSPGTEVKIAGRTTDANGKIQIDPSWYNDGDNVRAAIDAGVFTTQKPLHQDSIIQGVAYRILLDNVKFDERTSLPATTIHFDSYSASASVKEQNLVLDHTTLLFDLLVSIEWDADKAYTDEMQQGFRLLSNYLYDVYDGQVALGKVEIFDDKDRWDGADICFTASTETWPHAGIQGYLNARLGEDEQTLMPPRWFGGTEQTRANLVDPNYLGKFVSDMWRTVGHELGHQLMGFRDEYVDLFGKSTDSAIGYANLGYMTAHYTDTSNHYKTPLDRMFASELSSPQRYQPIDTITRQYRINRSDCWTQFKRQFEGTHNGVFCPIYMPSDRTTLAAGGIALQGPNENSYSAATYDASSFERQFVSNPHTSIRQYVMTLSVPGKSGNSPAPLVRSYLRKKSNSRLLDLGLTNNDGKITFFGSESGDTYLFSGNVGNKTTGTAVSLNGTFAIHTKTDAHIASADTAVLLHLVSGDFRIVPSIRAVGTNGGALTLNVNKQFSQTASAEIPFDHSASDRRDFTFDAAHSQYAASFDSLPGGGTILTTTGDDASQPFLLPLQYASVAFGSDIFGDHGGVWLLLDSANAPSVEGLTVVSSGWATILNGLDPDVEQAGDVHAIGLRPETAQLDGTNGIIIRYSDDDVRHHPESSLRIFKWSDANAKWEALDGSVDTVNNEVHAPLSSGGTYACFTTSSSAGVHDDVAPASNMTLAAFSHQGIMTATLGIPSREAVTLRIYDGLGRTITTLVSAVLDAGVHEFTWNTTSVPSGTYFCTAASPSGVVTAKVQVMR